MATKKFHHIPARGMGLQHPTGEFEIGTMAAINGQRKDPFANRQSGPVTAEKIKRTIPADFRSDFLSLLEKMDRKELCTTFFSAISLKDSHNVEEILRISKRKNFDLQNIIYRHGEFSMAFDATSYNMKSPLQIVSSMSKSDTTGECAIIAGLLIAHGAI